MARAPVSGQSVRGLPRSGAQRIHLFVVVNVVFIWTAVVGLTLLDRAVGPSTALRADVLVLIPAGLLYLAALVLVRRGREWAAATTALLTTWVVSFAITWFTPVITPLGPIIMHAPALILTDVYSLRTRTRILALTVLLTGALVVLGEDRRPVWEATEQNVPVPSVLVGLATMVVAALFVAGLRDSMLRIARHTEELQSSRSRLATAAIDARRSIERDLHDGAQQRLATLAIDLGRVSRAIDTDPDRARELVRALQDQLQEATRELRDLAHGIYPPVLEERGLAGALPAAARRTVLPTVVDVRLTHRHDKAVEAAVYFCCLEAMQNADRHSGGRHIRVRVLDEGDDVDGGLRFAVSDDGTGFEADAAAQSHGLAGMRDRIHSAGGTLDVVSGADGTSVTGRFPPGTAIPSGEGGASTT